MIKYNKRCKVCSAVKEDKKLLKEIFNSKYYLKTTGHSLSSIARRYDHLFTYESLQNHTKKHQFISQDQYDEVHLQRAAEDASKEIIKHKLESNDVFDEVMKIGMENLQDGKLTMKTSDLIQAARLKKEFQLKEKDQQLTMMQMVYHFSSGESDRSDAHDRAVIEGQTVNDYDPTRTTTDNTKRRQDQASSFYQSLAGDAPTPRAD